MSLASDKRAALRFARRRGFAGKKLPPGVPYSPKRCPLGKAIGCSVAGHLGVVYLGKRVEWGGEHFYIPAPATSRFIRNFDKGLYPELVA
jgi:hypothetical protein